MGHQSAFIGSAAEAQTPPASAPPSTSGSKPSLPVLERRLAQQRALVDFARMALRAATLAPVIAAGAELLDRFPALPGASQPDAADEELAFRRAIHDVVQATSAMLGTVQASRHAALHDPLTGLANRSLIIDHLKVALARAARRSTLAAIVFLDLDGFKRVNDTLGHAAGDELLVQIAERLRHVVRPADTLGRWGGDEFVVVCDDLEQRGDVPVIFDRIAAAFDPVFRVAGTDLSIAASIGVAVSGGIDDAVALVVAADSEMYRAKRDHGSLRRDRPEVRDFEERRARAAI